MEFNLVSYPPFTSTRVIKRSIVTRFDSGLNPSLVRTKNLQYASTTRVKLFECSNKTWNGEFTLASYLPFTCVRVIIHRCSFQ